MDAVPTGQIAAVLKDLTRIYQVDRRDPPHHGAPLTDDHVRGWALATGMAQHALYDHIALELARGFHRGDLDFGFCDFVINQLHAVISTTADDRPVLFWEVFLAFDAGEFHPDGDSSRDPVETFTKPLIAAVVETHAKDRSRTT